MNETTNTAGEWTSAGSYVETVQNYLDMPIGFVYLNRRTGRLVYLAEREPAENLGSDWIYTGPLYRGER